MRRLMLSVMATTLAIAARGAIAQTSSGTAFAVAPEMLVTNQHVVDGCSSIEVISSDEPRKASVIASDADNDLAVLRVSGLKGPTAQIRNPRTVQLGEPVMVFGYPLSGALSSGGNFTSGLVSALRGLRDAAGKVQITAPVQPGNSGGPLMDASGLVIGVVEAKLDALRTARATGDIPQNVNFAISLQVLAEFLAKNNVAFRDGTASAPLNTARVAQLAQSFTHRVECRGASRQVKSAPDINQSRLPPCPGSFNVNTWTNCAGTRTFPSGNEYVGEFRHGRRKGKGTLTLLNGTRYIGEFSDGKLHGQVTVAYASGGNYVGEYREGKKNGQGTASLPDGGKYVGEWRDNKLNGQGTFTFANGSKYVGEFKDSKSSGRGIEYRPDGSVLRSGVWENGLFKGQ